MECIERKKICMALIHQIFYYHELEIIILISCTQPMAYNLDPASKSGPKHGVLVASSLASCIPYPVRNHVADPFHSPPCCFPHNP